MREKERLFVSERSKGKSVGGLFHAADAATAAAAFAVAVDGAGTAPQPKAATQGHKTQFDFIVLLLYSSPPPQISREK